MTFSRKNLVTEFLESESGASAIEYGFLMATISLALVIALQATGASLSSLFGFVGSTIMSSIPTPPPPHSG